MSIFEQAKKQLAESYDAAGEAPPHTELIALAQAESLARIADALERLVDLAETSNGHDALIDLYRGAGPA